MPTLLITGASRGLGLEFVRQYSADGWTVHACCRNPDTATDLRALTGDIRIHRLDVAETDEVKALATALEDERLDLLINNAGIFGPRPQGFGNCDKAAWLEVFATNAVGPMLMAEAFRPHLARAGDAKLVNVSSQLGSIAENGGAYQIYSASKAALNSLMTGAALALKEDGIVTVLVHPGWVHTDMGGERAPLAPEESIANLRALIGKLGPDDNGRFLSHDGREIPW
jgi:NAD(P)-dependent dehydrogenase (short-subunit alcohol dehydrogenase family)